MKRLCLMSLALLLVISLGALGCPQPVDPPAPPVAPTVELDSIEVANFHPLHAEWPADSAVIRGFMDLATILDITNPNDFPMLLDEIRFNLALEAQPGLYLKLHLPINYEDMWIPAGMTNQVRVEALFDSHIAFGALLVAHGLTLKDLGIDHAGLIKKWFEPFQFAEEYPHGIEDWRYVIHVTAGMATFFCPAGETHRSEFSGVGGRGN